jgi:hypothetical protein
MLLKNIDTNADYSGLTGILILENIANRLLHYIDTFAQQFNITGR